MYGLVCMYEGKAKKLVPLTTRESGEGKGFFSALGPG